MRSLTGTAAKEEANAAAAHESADPFSEQSSALLHNLILSTVDGVIAADMQGRIFIFNDAAARILVYSPQEALGGMNIRSLYAGGAAEEVIRRLRS